MSIAFHLATATVVVGFLTANARCANFTWVGGTSRAWTTALNWSPSSGYPDDSGDTATIPDRDSTSNDPLVSSALTVGTIHVDDDGYAEVGSGGVLTIIDITVDAQADLVVSGTGSVTAGGVIAVNGRFEMTGSSYVDANGTINVDATFGMDDTSVLDVDILHVLDEGYFTVRSTTNAEIEEAAGLNIDAGAVVYVIGTLEIGGDGHHSINGDIKLAMAPTPKLLISTCAPAAPPRGVARG